MLANRKTLVSLIASSSLTVLILGCLLQWDLTDGASVDPASKTPSVRLNKAIDEIRRLSEINRLLDLKVQQALNADGRGSMSDLIVPVDHKREASWDMDYGWGGGRFGKRLDSLGIAGRFGRSIHYDEEEH